MKFISPDFRRRFRKFRQNRRAFWSLLLLLGLFVATLPAEWICNDKPLVLIVDGRWYFPVLFDYSYRDFGGEKDLAVSDYRSGVFQDLLQGRTTDISTDSLYHRAGSEGPAITGVRETSPRNVHILNAPIPHSYKSTSTASTLPRSSLVGPFATSDGDATQPGGIADGHWLGTDIYGKDVLARLIYGFRFSLIFGLALAITSTVLGCIIGAIQGYFGGWVDLAGQRAIEIWDAIPELLMLMLLSDVLSRSGELSGTLHILLLFGILNLSAWMGMATQMRGMFLRGRSLEYVRAARALGAGNRRIMFTHILPNALTPIVTFFPFKVSGGILALVGLDFLGFGLKYPTPSLGEMLAQGQTHIHAWWITIPTFLTLCILLILLTFVGEGVRNAFDPRQK